MRLAENEILNRFRLYITTLEDRIKAEGSISDIIDDVPAIIVMSRPHVTDFVHTNKKHQLVTGFTPNEVRENSSEYTGSIVHPDSMKTILRILPDFYACADKHKTLAFLQYVRLMEDKAFTPLFTFTKPSKLPDDLVIRLSVNPQEMGAQVKKMENVVQIDQFRHKHFNLFQQLTQREMDVVRLLATGYNNPEIADQLFISRCTVETHRKRIKEKLAISSFRDLIRYALAFNLVKF